MEKIQYLYFGEETKDLNLENNEVIEKCETQKRRNRWHRHYIKVNKIVE